MSVREIRPSRLVLPSRIALTLLLAAAFDRAALAGGLSATGSRLIFETSANPLHAPAIGDQLGYAVARGDFDGDGFDDLAIGLRSDDAPIAGLADVGQVQIRFGGPSGLDTLTLAKYLWQGGSASVNAPEAGDHFGESLAVGDFDDDGFDDLAIGIPGEDINATSNAGAVEVRYGAANRSQALETRRHFFEENTPDIPDTAGVGDEFGHSLAAGDFDGDGFDDLAIGVPLESVAGYTDSGRVFVLHGTRSGIAVPGARTYDTESPGVAFIAHSSQYFGAAIAAADFDDDGFCDLAVGSPGVSFNRGVVFVLPGGPSGLSGSFNYYFLQGSFGLADSSESGDSFGYALAVGSFNGDAFPDLAIGVPGESMANGGPDLAAAGAVHVQFGSAAGVVGAALVPGGGGQFWTQMSTGVPGEPELGDSFGRSLAAGDFDGDGLDELAIGVPFEQTFRGPEEGDVIVLPGSPSGPIGAGAVAWNLEAPGILGDMNPGDRLGWSLAAGDFDHSGAQDLAIGIPNDGNIGGVLVLFGSAPGTPGTPGSLRFSLSTYAVNEGAGPATVTVQRTAGDEGPISVQYTATAGSATAGQDFAASSGTLSWADNDGGAKTFTVPITNDGIAEPSETIQLALAGPTGGATLDNAQKTATLTITDNDAATCIGGPETLCLNNARFAIDVNWRTADGTTGRGKAVPLPSAPDSGLIYFFGPGNIELLIKVLNACVPSLGNRYWVFFAATTNVEFTVVVTDTHTGASKSYFNPLNRPAPPVQDIAAFATCP